MGSDAGDIARYCRRTIGGLWLAPELVWGIHIELPVQCIVGHEEGLPP